MTDYPIFDLGFLLNASKEKDYQMRCKQRFFVLDNFLKENNLAKGEMVDNIESLTITSRIMKSDLTEEGFNFVKKALDKWLRAQDKGKSPTDITILERS